MSAPDWSDPLRFITANLSIIDKRGALVPFDLNDEQLGVLKTAWSIYKSGEPVRLVILKARQLGISTLFQALGYWVASTKAHQTALVVSHTEQSAAGLLQMMHRFYTYDERRNSDEGMPEQQRANKGEIVFDVQDWRERGTKVGLDSRIIIASARDVNAGHSQTLRFFHGSEVARWPKPDLLAGILNALVRGPGTFGVMESTAHGLSGPFHDTWSGACDRHGDGWQERKQGRNGWVPIFLSWRGRSEYRVKLRPVERERLMNSLTPVERRLHEQHGVDAEQLEWRRQIIAGPECKSSEMSPEDVFREQYPMVPEEAFVATGKAFFDQGRILVGDAAARRVAAETGRIVLSKGKGIVRPTAAAFIRDAQAPLRVWRHPEDGHDYVIGADAAHGIKGGDYSVAYVMDRVAKAVVACWRGRLDPETYAADLVKLAWYYNEAFLAPEANNVGVIIAKRCAQEYGRLAHKQRFDLGDGAWATPDFERPGFYTSDTTRKEVLAELRVAFNAGEVVIPDPEFYTEARTFVVQEKATGADQSKAESRPRALGKNHDDCVLAMAITWAVNRVQVAGAIRAPKVVGQPVTDWRVAAMREDVDAERGKVRRPPGIYDEEFAE